MSRKGKTLIILIGVVIALLLSFLIYWKATEDSRALKKEMEKCLEEMEECLEVITAYRNGEKNYINVPFSSTHLADPVVVDFLSEQVSEMLNNGEYYLLDELLDSLENKKTYIPEIQDKVTDTFKTIPDFETAEDMIRILCFLDYYNQELYLTRNSPPITSYIEANGINEISTTPGTGYYGTKEDYSFRNTIGLPNSPLYDAGHIKYQGDFEFRHEWGVELNSWYEETRYDRTIVSFRDNTIDFSPDDGECIYSGDYLFCFSLDGKLFSYDRIYIK